MKIIHCLNCGEKVIRREPYGDWDCIGADGCGAWINYGNYVGYRKYHGAKPNSLPSGTLLILKDTQL